MSRVYDERPLLTHIPIPPGILLDMQNARCIEGGIYPYTLFFSHDSVLGLFMHGF